ncbi:Hypothetical protein MVR_LOCUS168 [uncultured virus]|nr:Hypothetical protein MVR_LOCUS168 [uncultured virus]
MDKLEAYAMYVNRCWSTWIDNSTRYKSTHIFIKDMDMVKENNRIYDSAPIYINREAKPVTFNLRSYVSLAQCPAIPTKPLPHKLVLELHSSFVNDSATLNWLDVKKKLDSLALYLPYSTVNLRSAFKTKEPNSINILVLGAGPTGLYIANYLNSMHTSRPKLNVMVVDNRVSVIQRLRLPYTRSRIFAIHLYLFTTFFPKIAEMLDLIRQSSIPIKYLEYILLVMLYGSKIPICFTDELSSPEALLKFMDRKHVDIVYDCTGGRFESEWLSTPVDHSFPTKTKMSDRQYQVVRSGPNEYGLQWKNNIANRYFLSIEVYDADGIFMYAPINGTTIEFKQDLAILSELHNQCFKLKQKRVADFLKIFDSLRDLGLSKIIQGSVMQDATKSFKFSIIEPHMQHKIRISTVIGTPANPHLYIGAGDTIFTSHFAVGAGLNRLLEFIRSTLWYVQTLDDEDAN